MNTLLEKVGTAVRDHRARHRPTGFSFAVADSVSHLDAAAWDSLTEGASLFMRRPYLGVLESAGPANVVPRAALVYRGRKPVAAVACQLVKVKAARVLVAGNLLSWGQHAAAFARDEAPAALWPGVAEALYRIRRAERLSGRTDLVLVKDAAEGDAAAASLARFGYGKVRTDPDMVLDLRPEWRSFEDYLASLQSKYRSAIRAVDRRLAESGCAVERLEALGPHAERLHALYSEVHDAASVRPTSAGPAYFPALAKALGADFRCTVIRRGGDILGFGTSVRDGDTAVGYYLGYERALRDELPLYFRLLHALVADAIAWRCKRLSLGRTALAPKAGLGARPAPTVLWVRHPNALVNAAVSGLLGRLSRAEAPERSPFKA